MDQFEKASGWRPHQCKSESLNSNPMVLGAGSRKICARWDAKLRKSKNYENSWVSAEFEYFAGYPRVQLLFPNFLYLFKQTADLRSPVPVASFSEFFAKRNSRKTGNSWVCVFTLTEAAISAAKTSLATSSVSRKTKKTAKWRGPSSSRSVLTKEEQIWDTLFRWPRRKKKKNN